MGPRDTHLLLRAFCDELARCGIAGACTSPGSRNTPILLAVVRDGGFPAWSHLDERTGAFFGLGLAKATGRPAVLCCTSGTAAVEYHPAVVEAHEARVPLIVLTADRPPELRQVGAGQAIDQTKLFGDAVRWFFDVGTGHEATPERMRWVRTLACRAVAAAMGPEPGPVHLNWPLREPLVLDEPLPPDASGRPGRRPFVVLDPPATPAPVPTDARRPVLVLGRREEGLGGLARAAGAAGWPVLADPLSRGRTGPGAIARYDALLRDPAAVPAPDLVVRAGDLPTSKSLRTWLAGLACEQWQVAADATWQDPSSVLTRRVGALDPQPAEPGWLEAWRALDVPPAGAPPAAAAPGVDALAATGATIVTAASLPVRDLEAAWPVLDDPPRVLANRGANGIDGTLATAFGVAAATGEPVVCHLGDVAFAYDAGALLCWSRLRIPLTILLIDNGGGRIFDRLPISTQTDVYEQHVLTPPGLDPAKVAVAYDLPYTAPTTEEELRNALRRPGLVHLQQRV